MNGDRIAVLVDRVDLCPEPDPVLELVVERVRQVVRAADDLLHVLVGLAEVLAELLRDRVVDAGLHEVHDAVHLDGALGEALGLQELAQREAVVLAHDVLPAGDRVGLEHRLEVLRRLLPQVRRGASSLVVGNGEAQLVRREGGLLRGHPPAADVHETLRVAHQERPEAEAEVLAVPERQVVDARDPHRARLGVEAGRERAKRVDAPANTVLGLEDERIVARSRQLVARDEAGHPGTDDDDPRGGLVASLEGIHVAVSPDRIGDTSNQPRVCPTRQVQRAGPVARRQVR